tara:strand:+ start:433 stop:2280 length:1848 start_codon:yes stop_codon:yes gene_type:complete
MRCLHYFIFFLLSSSLAAKDRGLYKIDHLEPPFWWAGMIDSSLQLMVHGQNISDLDPVLDHKGVRISGVHRTKNPNYLFIDLVIKKTLENASFDLIFKKSSEEIVIYKYDLLNRKPESSQRQGFSQKDVIYLITPDRFANGDPSNDTKSNLKEGLNRDSKYGRHGGDIEGVINNLDYISEMGFTQIWLNPLLENDQESYSYHGYSTTDYYNIDPRYGTNSLYQKLSHLSGAKGIGIIKDIVLNHIGSEHWWMSDLPTKNWINNSGKFKISSHNHQSVHDPHLPAKEKKAFTDGWFDRTMPDLNQSNPYLAKYLVQNSIWWIEYADLSGFRVDTYPYVDKTFLSMWSERISTEYPAFSFVGEEWSTDPVMVAYWQRGSMRYDDYRSFIPNMMDFPLQQALVDALLAEESWNSGVVNIYSILAGDYLYGDPYDLVVFAGNHDIKRIYSQLDNDISLLKMAMGFILTTRGIPQIYYGTEIAMQSSRDHGDIRSDFPGGWEGDKANGFESKRLKKSQLDVQDYFKKLLKWRKKSLAVAKGRLVHYKPRDGMYTYFREFNDQLVMVVVNNNRKLKDLDLKRFSDVFDGKKKAIGVFNRKQYYLDKKITVPAKTTFILDVY